MSTMPTTIPQLITYLREQAKAHPELPDAINIFLLLADRLSSIVAAAPQLQDIETARDGDTVTITALHVPGTPQPVRDLVGRYAMVRVS